MADKLRWLWGERHASLTMGIVTVCPVLFVVLTVLDLVHVVSWQQSLSVLGLSYTGLVQRRWLFQCLTAPLLHANLTHLAFNMLTLWMLGPEVERVLGRCQYIVFSGLCAGCAMAGFLLWTPGMGAIGLGYSGVIFGILVAQATLFPHRVLYVYAVFPLKMKYAVLILSAVELYLLVTTGRPGSAHSAHVFGALGAWGYLQGARWWVVRPRASRYAATRRGLRRRRALPSAPVPRSPQPPDAQSYLQHALACARHATTLPQAIASLERAMTLDPSLRPLYAKLLRQWKMGIVL
jgi:membrane associated rhomboid family serine protease